MGTNKNMIDYLMEQCSPLGRITHRRMFGADCLFVNGVMFAIITDGIFIKKAIVDESDVRFSYLRQGRVVYLNYVKIDDELLDEQEELISVIRRFMYF